LAIDWRVMGEGYDGEKQRKGSFTIKGNEDEETSKRGEKSKFEGGGNLPRERERI